MLECKNLKKYFPIKSGLLRKKIGDVKAVDDISFNVGEKEVVGLVGESGSGKSTAGLSVVRLLEPSSGQITFLGKDLLAMGNKELKTFRQNAQIVFQDPYASLNPRKTILGNVGGSLLYHKLVASKEEQIEKTLFVLKQVGLKQEALYKYPHEFSGGQLQRLAIARSIIVKPKLIVLDEAVSALDLSIQAQILNLLYDLKEEYQLSYLFISHDLAVVRHICDKVLVMFRGKIVESAPTLELFENPQHPYTKELLQSLPKKHPKEKRPLRQPFEERQGSFSGCSFYTRCPFAKPICKDHGPPQKKLNESHTYSCVL